MRVTIATACAAFAMTAWTASATAQSHGDNSAEVIAGVVFPLGEDDYENFLDPSFKFGGRVVFFGSARSRGRQVGLEVDFDWTPAANDLDDTRWVDASFNRFRVLAGARMRKDINPKASFFIRAAGGIDIVTGRIEEQLLGTDWEENDLGVALEFGGGVTAHLGDLLIGAQAAIPIAIHWDDDPNDYWEYDYTGYDFDLLFTVGKSF